MTLVFYRLLLYQPKTATEAPNNNAHGQLVADEVAAPDEEVADAADAEAETIVLEPSVL